MAGWEPLGHFNTLLLARRDLGNGRQEFKLCPFFRRHDADQGGFLSPLSLYLFENLQLTFQRIGFIEAASGPNAEGDGDTLLTSSNYYSQVSLGA